ncbi:hypothetical protein D9M70_266260 [compost metagenome]
MAQGGRLRARQRLAEQLLLAGQPLRQGEFASGANGRQHPLRRLLAGLAGCQLGLLEAEEVVARFAQGGLGRAGRQRSVQQFAGEAARLGEQVSVGLDQAVDQAQRVALAGVERLSVEHHLQGGLHADQARQALGAAGAGKQPETHLRQAQAGVGAGDAMAAGQGQLQATAEGHAVDGGKQRLVDSRQIVQQLRQGRCLPGERRAEFTDIGAGAERQWLAVEDDGANRRIAGGLLAGAGQGLAQFVAEGIDRRMAQADQGQFVVAAVVDQLQHENPSSNGWAAVRPIKRWRVGWAGSARVDFRWWVEAHQRASWRRNRDQRAKALSAMSIRLALPLSISVRCRVALGSRRCR